MRKGIKDEAWLEQITREYGSLERYVTSRRNDGADPLIMGYAPFQYLLVKALLKEGDIIRTNLEGGMKDGHYIIRAEGQLEGVEAAGGLYSGDPGIHNPEKILSLKRANNGWTLGTFAEARIIRSVERTS